MELKPIQTRRFSLAAAASLPLLFAAPAALPLLLCPARPAVAQEAPGDVEAARTSPLAGGLTLPRGAYRSTAKNDIAKFAGVLGEAAKNSDSRLSGVEVLIWSGGDGPRETLARTLSGAGYRYKTQAPIQADEGQVTLFVAKHDSMKTLMGMWIAQDDHLLLAWGAVTPNNGAKAESGGMADAADAALVTREKDEESAAPTLPTSNSSGVSGVAGVALPKGAARQNDAALTSGLGRLVADGAKEFKLPPRAGGPGKAEVYFWTGAAYKPGRAPFLRTLLQNALTEAGYDNYKLVDPAMDNTPNAFKDYEYGTGALDFVPADARHLYFYATSAKTGKSVVGAWFDQQSKNRLVLVIGEAGTLSAPAETNIPDVSGPDVWLVKNLKNVTQGMPPAPLPSFPKMTPKPGTVRGRVLDGGGKPIVGAHLIAWASAAGGFRTSTEGRTNAQGVYEIPLPVGICQIVNADCRVSYNGKTLLLPLHPADGERDNFNSKEGHIENFLLRASGSAGPDGGNYGASLRLLTWKAPMGSTVEVTLKPVGALLDGSRGRTLVLRFPVKTLSPETFVEGIPIGRYQLSAKVYDGEDALPLQARKTFRDEGEDDLPQPAASLDVNFDSENAGSLASLGRSGIKRFEVVLEP